MSIKDTHNFDLHDNEKLKLEQEQLRRNYELAIKNDLPFSETKKIYLRLKEIDQLLTKHQK